MLLPSLGVHLGFAHADLEGLVSLYPRSPLAHALFLSPLFWGFLSPEGSDLIRTSHLGLSVPKSLILCIMSSCESLFPSAATEERPSDDGWARH